MPIKRVKNSLFGRFMRSKPLDVHVRNFKTFDDIKSMAFLLDGSDPVELRQLLNRLHTYSDIGKKVFFLGYVKKFPPFEYEQITWLTKKDLNWIGVPITGKIKTFIDRDFDVLINTSLKTIRPLQYVSTYSKAHLRIGKFDDNKTYCYDFMLHLDSDASVNDYLDQVERYLKMLR